MDTREENESKISDKADDKEILNKQNEHEEKKIKGPKDATNSEPSGVSEQAQKPDEDSLDRMAMEIPQRKEQVRREEPTVDADTARPVKIKTSISTQHAPTENTSEQATEKLLPVAQPTQTPVLSSGPDSPLTQVQLDGALIPPPSDLPLGGVLIPTPSPSIPVEVSQTPSPLGCAPPPPPPPRVPGFPPGPTVASQLPYGMKPKKKYKVEGQTKRIYWKMIQANKLKENSFWVKVEEWELEDDFILQLLMEKLCVKDTAQRERGRAAKYLRVLDPKSAMNLSMLLGKLKTPYTEIRRRILEVDTEHLTTGMVEQLIKYLPEPEQIKELGALKEEYDDLTEAEQFIVTIEDLTEIKPRLQSILFKMTFSETVICVKQDIIAVTVSLEEIKTNTRLARILELILFIGNYLNEGSSNAQSLGFDISFLSKLKNTKLQDNKLTLVHFLVSVIEEKYPDLMQFKDDFTSLEKASKVSDEMIQRNFCEIEKSLKQLTRELVNFDESSMEGDKFLEVMKSFVGDAKRNVVELNDMYKKMGSMFEDMSEYFCFDKKQYKMNDFFGDIKTFQDNFKEAIRENAKQR